MKHVVLGGVAVYRIVGSYSPNSFFKASAHGFVGNTGGIGSFDVTCMCSVNVNRDIAVLSPIEAFVAPLHSRLLAAGPTILRLAKLPL